MLALVNLMGTSLGSRSNLLTTPLYGAINDEAYYYMNIFIGSPPQKQSVILDTGSSILAFPCTECHSCGKHVNSFYDVKKSMTSRWLHCDDDICYSDRCTKDHEKNIHHCDYYQAYSEGSSIGGHYFSDLISLTAYRIVDVDAGPDPPSMTYATQLTTRYDHIGCHELETKLFVNQLANGIMGVAFPHKQQPTAMDALFDSSPRYKSDELGTHDGAPGKRFSVCISDQGGIMTMGGMDPLYVNLDATWTKLAKSAMGKQNSMSMLESVKNVFASSRISEDDLETLNEKANEKKIVTKITSNNNYNIGARTLLVVTPSADGSEIKEPLMGAFGNTIIDSGTTYTYLPPKLYASIFETTKAWCRNIEGCIMPKSHEGLSDVCFRSDQTDPDKILEDLDAKFPTFIVATQDQAHLPWQPRSYMYDKRDKHNTWCHAIDNNGTNETVFGMSFIKNMMAVFDREDMVFEILPGNCPVTTDQTRDKQKGPDLELSDHLAMSTAEHEFSNIQVETRKFDHIREGYERARDYMASTRADYTSELFTPIFMVPVAMGCIACLILILRQRRANYTLQFDGDVRQQAPEEEPLSPQSRSPNNNNLFGREVELAQIE